LKNLNIEFQFFTSARVVTKEFGSKSKNAFMIGNNAEVLSDIPGEALFWTEGKFINVSL
jgi:hypothetical protein